MITNHTALNLIFGLINFSDAFRLGISEYCYAYLFTCRVQNVFAFDSCALAKFDGPEFCCTDVRNLFVKVLWLLWSSQFTCKLDARNLCSFDLYDYDNRFSCDFSRRFRTRNHGEFRQQQYFNDTYTLHAVDICRKFFTFKNIKFCLKKVACKLSLHNCAINPSGLIKFFSQVFFINILLLRFTNHTEIVQRSLKQSYCEH